MKTKRSKFFYESQHRAELDGIAEVVWALFPQKSEMESVKFCGSDIREQRIIRRIESSRIDNAIAKVGTLVKRKANGSTTSEESELLRSIFSRYELPHLRPDLLASLIFHIRKFSSTEVSWDWVIWRSEMQRVFERLGLACLACDEPHPEPEREVFERTREVDLKLIQFFHRIRKMRDGSTDWMLEKYDNPARENRIPSAHWWRYPAHTLVRLEKRSLKNRTAE